MDFERQLLFFFSALGAFNGLFLSLYFGLFIKNRNRATTFLAALLFVISVRVAKSVFLTFYPGVSSTFVSIGLTACFLIGPLTYLYTRVALYPDTLRKWSWVVHVLPICILMVYVSIQYPYAENRELWWRTPPRIMGSLLFALWTLYLGAALFLARPLFKKWLRDRKSMEVFDYWVISILIGCFVVWLAYNTTTYTSYIVGAISFSFTLYVTFFYWFLRRRKNALTFLQPAEKYAKKKIPDARAEWIEKQLQQLFSSEKPHLDPNLKLSEVADRIKIGKHELSQFLNDNLGTGFANYINALRIETAVDLLHKDDRLTLEAIGNDCGFKSNSSFYSAFKKFKGVTPAQFKRSLVS
ncbi:helix-turn-helix domain-containing protein [Flagellimonas sp. DF-77]|uniref:helix-turn-helix domain-containing protein n=1 Tax=Flagellimonas algarum TaxID=3230298 RepID=UPI0033920198